MSYALRNSLIIGVLLLFVVGLGFYWVGVRQTGKIEALQTQRGELEYQLEIINSVLAIYDSTLAELIEKYEQGWAYNIAYVLAFRGEADRAFEWLDKAVEQNHPGLGAIAVTKLFANIHDDPRWLPFLESIGHSPEQLAAIEFEVTLPQ